MNKLLLPVYSTSSYLYLHKGTVETAKEFTVTSISLDKTKNYIVLTATSHVKCHCTYANVSFLNISLVPATIKKEGTTVTCTLVLNAVLQVLAETRSPKRRITSSASAKTNGDAPIEGNAAAKALLFILSEIEIQEKKRTLAEERLNDIQLEKETQMKRLITQKKRAISKREELLPSIEHNITPVYTSLIELTHIPTLVKEQLELIVKLIGVPIVPLTSEQLKSKYENWLKLNRLAVLSLSDRGIAEKITVKDEEKRKTFKQQEVLPFAVNFAEHASGMINFFVTQLPDYPQPSIGLFRKRLIIGGESKIFGKIIRTEGIVTDWIAVIADAARVSRSSIIAGTAYVLASELLEER